MVKYQVNESPVESLLPDLVRKEASELRHQLTCVSTDIASKRAWADADGKTEDNANKVWMARARAFWGKLQKRYSLVREAERKLNRKDMSSKRHVRRDEFEAFKTTLSEPTK